MLADLLNSYFSLSLSLCLLFFVLVVFDISSETKSVIVNVIGDSGIDKLISLLRNQTAPEMQRSAAILLASLAGNGTHNTPPPPPPPPLAAARTDLLIEPDFVMYSEDCIQKIVKQGGRQFMSQLVSLVQSGKVDVQTEINADQVECIKVIGQGVSGVVWKGTWRGEEVAIKKFDEEGIAFNEAEFRSEVALMRYATCACVIDVGTLRTLRIDRSVTMPMSICVM
jgi:hypothetical protein